MENLLWWQTIFGACKEENYNNNDDQIIDDELIYNSHQKDKTQFYELEEEKILIVLKVLMLYTDTEETL